MKEDDGNRPGAAGFVEDFTAAPEGSCEVEVAAYEVVLVVPRRGGRVGVGGRGAGVGVV